VKFILLLTLCLFMISCAGSSPRFTSNGTETKREHRKKSSEDSESKRGTKRAKRSVVVDGVKIRRSELRGIASWYGGNFQGKTTASGEKFDMNLYTGAHNTIPFNTIVEVVERSTGNSVKVRINDRGPTNRNRVIDLSKKAAEKLGMLEKGITEVDILIVK